MINCQCQGIEELFNEPLVIKQLDSYRSKGPDKTTRMLTEALKEAGVSGLNLLDVGGGVGAVEHELIAAGVEKAVDVDASQAYLHAAREEAERRGMADCIEFHYGNFVELAGDILPADIVTLDRAVCCYPDMEQMVGLSAARAGKLYGLVYPRDTWLARLGVGVINLVFRLMRRPFRIFVHPTRAVDALVRSHGLKQRYWGGTLIWQVAVYSH
jgi:hypothetical protein